MKLQGNMSIVGNELYIAGVSCKKLKEEYETPLYVFDERLVRSNCQEFVKHFRVNENKNRVAYAGKAFLPMYMCNIIDEEGLYLDVVSGGELYTAKKANFPMNKVLFHGNNKTDEEVEMGVELGVGRFVVDNYRELNLLEKICEKKNKKQKVYLRIAPGIDVHTHSYIQTGQIDSKFGFTLSNGDLYKAADMIKKYKNIELVGLHAHIGSQILELEPYLYETEIMMNLVKEIRHRYNIEIKEVDLGGGFGVYYTKEDNPRSIKDFCEGIIKTAKKVCAEMEIEAPILIIEPGRSIVANAGSTLYTVGSIKNIENVRTYISIDGGMTDNIRPSLYNAKYECAVANKMRERLKNKITISGKCCESGDILIKDIAAAEVETGDILVVFSTGAYGYSMSSNYNKMAKPAVVSVKNGSSRLICKRQSYEELLSLEII